MDMDFVKNTETQTRESLLALEKAMSDRWEVMNRSIKDVRDELYATGENMQARNQELFKLICELKEITQANSASLKALGEEIQLLKVDTSAKASEAWAQTLTHNQQIQELDTQMGQFRNNTDKDLMDLRGELDFIVKNLKRNMAMVETVQENTQEMIKDGRDNGDKRIDALSAGVE